MKYLYLYYCRWGFTPLIEAQRFHHKDVVDFLLSHVRENIPDQYQHSLQALQTFQSKQRRKMSAK